MIISGSARFWFPCYAHQNDKVTHEIIVSVPDAYEALSNGRLVSVTEDKESKTKTFHWFQEQPNATHLAMFVAGPYEILKDSLGSLPVNYWVWKQDVKNNTRYFHRSSEMI